VPRCASAVFIICLFYTSECTHSNKKLFTEATQHGLSGIPLGTVLGPLLFLIFLSTILWTGW